MIVFTEVVRKSPNKGGWHYVSLAKDVLEELRSQAGKSGNIPVRATIGQSTWTSTVMSRGNQQWYLAIKSEVRNAESIREGDKVTVQLTPNKDKLPKKG